LNLPLFIARRYLISKKKQHIINIISAISAIGVCVGTFALVVVLSVFNGFDGLIKSYFSMLDPDLKITPREGKYFNPGFMTDSLLTTVPGIAGYARVIEDNALLTCNNRQFIATLKGVPSNFCKITSIDTFMVSGAFVLEADDAFYAIPGQGVATYLGIGPNSTEPIHVYVPRKGLKMSLDPNKALNHNYIFTSGIFSLLEDVDARTVFVPYEFAAQIFETGSSCSTIEIKLVAGSSVKKVKKMLEKLLGPDYVIKNKYQQHDALYKTMKSEKWVTYMILAFIIVVASFNILGSLSMLIIDKKEDIGILRSIGASPLLIQRIFLFEGWLISFIGTIAGLLLGVLICWIQIHFELISLPGEGSFIISAYPVKIETADLLLIFTVVMVIGFLAAWYPVRHIAAGEFRLNPSLREG